MSDKEEYSLTKSKLLGLGFYAKVLLWNFQSLSATFCGIFVQCENSLLFFVW